MAFEAYIFTVYIYVLWLCFGCNLSVFSFKGKTLLLDPILMVSTHVKKGKKKKPILLEQVSVDDGGGGI